MSAPRPSLRESADGGDGINLTPLLDVLFLILFFFLMATEAKRQTPALQINLPQVRNIAQTRAALPDDILLVTVTGRNAIWVDTDRAEAAELDRRLERAKASGSRTALIRADQESNSPALIDILNACQRAGLEAMIESAPPGKPAAPAP
jgi:biopolymer transport protein ExbD